VGDVLIQAGAAALCGVALVAISKAREQPRTKETKEYIDHPFQAVIHL